MRIDVRHITKKIGDKCILKDISLTFEEDINVLIGENGAGKTTFLRIVGLLDSPTSGEILYDGKPSTKCKLSLRRHIGFVFQTPLVLNRTVRENVVAGLFFRKIKVNEDEIKNILSYFDMQDKINTLAKNLSGGEKQRLQLVRVLVMDPDVYILDEPTANIDPINSKKVEKIIYHLSSLKKTIIFSTHNLLQAKYLGKKIFFMKNGEIIKSGTPNEIFEMPSSRDIAEFSLCENVIYGRIERDGAENYLVVEGLKINIPPQEVSGSIWATIKPEDILISKTYIFSSARNCFEGVVEEIKNMGIFLSVKVRCADIFLVSYITKQSAVDLDLKLKDKVYLIFKATAVNILKDR